MVDYVTLMLINMCAGLTILGLFLWFGFESDNRKGWVPGLLMSGVVAELTGFAMTFTRPLTHVMGYDVHWANMVYGEMTVLLGMSLLGAALALWMNRALYTVAVYGMLAGIAAVVLGVGIIVLHVHPIPLWGAIGLILTGAAGVVTLPAVRLARGRPLRWLSGAMLLAAAMLWGYMAYAAYWMHLSHWAK